MAVGKFGAVLAVFIFVLGFELPLAWARIDPSRMFVWSMTAKEFMAVPLISVLIFAGFVATGIVNRRRSEIHRPMMLLATLTVISAATDRIPAIVSLFDRTIWGTTFGPFFPPLVVGALLLIVKWALTRSFDRYFRRGVGGARRGRRRHREACDNTDLGRHRGLPAPDMTIARPGRQSRKDFQRGNLVALKTEEIPKVDRAAWKGSRKTAGDDEYCVLLLGGERLARVDELG